MSVKTSDKITQKDGMHIRTKRFLPKRHMEPVPLFELDSETMDWMKSHTVDDVATIAISRVSEGKDATKAVVLAAELTKLEWQMGTREDVSDRLDTLDYYVAKPENQQEGIAAV